MIINIYSNEITKSCSDQLPVGCYIKPLCTKHSTRTCLDGSSQKIHRSANVWEYGIKSAVIRFISSKTVREIALGSIYVQDINKKDNHLIIKN